MQTLRHLVVGTDFSDGADQALELAIKLAIAAGARISLVHVCELDVDGNDDRRLMQCGESLARVVAGIRGHAVDVTGVLRSGKPWQKLDNVAADVGASLIVVGRHGGDRGIRVDIGSVADQLVRSASRPVLTVACKFGRLDAEAHETNNA